MAHWVPLPGTLSGVDDKETQDMLLRTFSSVFPYTYSKYSLHRVGIHLLGSDRPIEVSSTRISELMARDAILTDLTEWDRVRPSFFQKIQRLELSPESPLVTDDRPHLEFYLMRALRDGRQKELPSNYWP